MSLIERIRAAWTILWGEYIERVDIRWTRPDGKPAGRIWVGKK